MDIDFREGSVTCFAVNAVYGHTAMSKSRGSLLGKNFPDMQLLHEPELSEMSSDWILVMQDIWNSVKTD